MIVTDPKSFKCIKCGSNVEFDPTTGKIKCTRCGWTDQMHSIEYNFMNSNETQILIKVNTEKFKSEILECLSLKIIVSYFKSKKIQVDCSFPAKHNLPLCDFTINNENYEVANTFNYDQITSNHNKEFVLGNLDNKISKISKNPDVLPFYIVLIELLPKPISRLTTLDVPSEKLTVEIVKRIKSNHKIKGVYYISNRIGVLDRSNNPSDVSINIPRWRPIYQIV